MYSKVICISEKLAHSSSHSPASTRLGTSNIATETSRIALVIRLREFDLWRVLSLLIARLLGVV